MSRKNNKQTDRQIDRQKDRQTDRQTDIQTNRQTDRHRGRQSDRRIQIVNVGESLAKRKPNEDGNKRETWRRLGN